MVLVIFQANNVCSFVMLIVSFMSGMEKLRKTVFPRKETPMKIEQVIIKELGCSNFRDGEADVDLQVVNGGAIIHKLHIEQITKAILESLLEDMPKEKEIGEFRYGGCNPDFDRGYNQALQEVQDYLKEKLG